MAIDSQFLSISSKIDDSSWIYLVDWILALVLSISFVFYYNRLLGFVITQILRITVWRKLGIKINVESIKFSPLGGRVFAKNLTIITSDHTVSILNLTFTWKYWLFKLTRLSKYHLEKSDFESDSSTKISNEELSCRFSLKIDGLEVFIYNRSAAYDSIMSMIEEEEIKKNVDGNSSDNHTFKNSQEVRFRNNKLHGLTNSSSSQSSENDTRNSGIKEDRNESNKKNDGAGTLSLAFILNFLPLNIEIRKGAFVLGNNTTPTILIASYKSAQGCYDMSKASNILDYYRVLIKMKYYSFQISMKSNIEYENHKTKQTTTPQNSKVNKTYKQMHKLNEALKKIERAFFRDVKTKEDELSRSYTHWKGLQRYIEDPKVQNRLDIPLMEQEYARYSLLLDSTTTTVNYQYDVPGINSNDVVTNMSGNPEFEFQVSLSNATIHYGPWAERQRVPLQNMFFPTLARDSKSTGPLYIPGSKRQYKGMNFSLSVEDELILRIPTKEPSKDIKQLINKPKVPTTTFRPFGWLEIKVGRGSKANYFNSFVTDGQKGWPNTFNSYLNSLEIRSSVNHDVLFMADRHIMDFDVGFPLKWNGKCRWTLNNTSENAQLFFLRDHTMLISDLMEDFSYGPATPYEYIRSFDYDINWKIIDYKIFLNVNEQNIINNAMDFTNNKYIAFEGDTFNSHIHIPLKQQLSRSTKIEYNIETSFFDLILHTPSWDSTNSFLKDSKLMGRANNFSITGSYLFFNSIQVHTSNQIVIDCIGDYITVKFYGFLVKYLFVIRENYFGEHKHFQTFEEYSNKVGIKDSGSGSLDSNSQVSRDFTNDTEENFDYWGVIKAENDIDLHFVFRVRHGLIVLPCKMYDTESHIGINFNSLDVDIRFNNYYMDLEADISPISSRYIEKVHDTDIMFDIPKYKEMYFGSTNYDLTINGLKIHSHRMFGVPPEEIIYFAKWDFSCGNINISGDGSYLVALVRSLKSFAFGYGNLENGVDIDEPVVYDTTAVSFRCPQIVLNIDLESEVSSKSYLRVTLDSILANFDDITNERYSDKIAAHIFKVVVEMDYEESKLLFFETSINFKNYCEKSNMVEKRLGQRKHMKQNDAPFHRLPFLLYEEDRDEIYGDALGCFKTSLSLPDINFPLTAASAAEFYLDILADSDSSETFDSNRENVTFLDKNLPNYNYDIEDYTHTYEVNPEVEYNNFIVDLHNIKVFLNPKAIGLIVKLKQNLERPSISEIMDDIHLEVIDQLKKLLNPASTQDNFRIVSSEILVKFGELYENDISEVFIKPCTVPLFSIRLLEPSLALSVYELHNDTNNLSELTAAFHLKSFFFSVSKPTSFVSPLHVYLEDLECWLTKENDNNLTGSFMILDINIDVRDSELTWLEKFLTSTWKSLDKSISELQEHLGAIENNSSKLVYYLTKAGESFHVDDDPSVLTKLSAGLRGLRGQKDHVRFHESWKISARLRHILNNIPDFYIDELNNHVNNSSALPRFAFEEVDQIFSYWRNWESNEPERKSFLEQVFYGDKSNPPNATVMAKIANLDLRIGIELKLNNFVKFTNIDLSFKNAQNVLINQNGAAKAYSIIFNTEMYESEISINLLDQISILCENNTGSDHGKEISVNSTVQNETYAVLININEFSQRLTLLRGHYELRFQNLSNSLNLSSFSTLQSNVCDSLKLDSLHVGIWHDKYKMYTLDVHQISAVLGCITKDDFTTILSDFLVSSINFKLLENNKEGTDFIDAVLAIVENDMRYTMDLFKSDGSSPKQESECKINSLINVDIDNISWLIEPLSPILINGSMSDLKMRMNLNNNMSFLDMSIYRINVDIDCKNTSIARLENVNYENHLKFNLMEDLYLITAELNFGFTKLFLPQAIYIIEILMDYQLLMKEKLNRIDLLVSKLKPDDNVELEKQDTKRFAIKFICTNEYIGLSSFIDKTKLLFEIERLSLSASNVSDGLLVNQRNLYYITKVYGDITIPTARISLLDRNIPVGISNILDINLSIKVLNDNDDSKLQSLQVESEYFRLCFSPQAVFRLVSILDEFNSKLDQFNLEDFQIGNKEIKGTNNDIQPKSSTDNIRISTVHVLSYNFCVGWLFPNPDKHYPGIIFGAERFYAVAGKNLGKFTLMGSYLSVANGKRSSNFFSKSSEKNNPNRAYMPTMQFTYTAEQLEESRNISVTTNGDELDVKFLSNSIILVEQAVLSGNQVQKFFDGREKPKIIKKEKPTQSEYINSIHSLFSRLDIVAVFAGSNVQLYKISDDHTLLNTPSLNLHSPAVRIYAMYKHQVASLKKHTFQCEILTSSSDNTLYSSCVPVIMDIVERVQKLFKNINNNNPDSLVVKDSPKDSKDSPKDSPKDLDIGNILQDVDLHIGLRIDRQHLSLSCEPTAKVEAIVAIEGICMQLNTNDEIHSALVIAVQLKSLKAFLRHIYSREVSGSISIQDVLLSNLIKLGDNSKILSISSFSDIEGYINVKQYQDLDLFKDIWFPPSSPPNSYYEEIERSHNRLLLDSSFNKNMSVRWKEVSSTYTIPWVLTFLVSNVSFNVDFGQSLGKFALTIDSISAISNKASDSSQELQIGFNLIRLASQGRLSGNLDITDINLHSTISWDLKSDLPDIPIVSLNAEIGKLQLKAAFDFHVFAIANLEQYYLEVFNRKGEHNISRDHLNVIIRLTGTEVYITSLAASTFLDIYNTISRMIQENRRSYRETLRDSSKDKFTGSNLDEKRSAAKALNSIKRLETKIQLFAGNILFQVYPSSFQDTKVFVVKLNESLIFFEQNEYTDGLSNEVDIKFNELLVLLSIKPSVLEDFIQQCTIDDFTKSAYKASGGTIFVFPSFKIYMKSFQRNNTTVIDYLYRSSFGGTVDVRWNLGSINFIREMFSIHSKALASRIEYSRKYSSEFLKEDPTTSDKTNEIHDLDQSLENKINALQESKYSYVPLAPPIIEAPQLKDLGNATPPLEWFGLNRDKFPNMTHQFAIVSLNKVNQEIDYQYSKLFGKS